MHVKVVLEGERLKMKENVKMIFITMARALVFLRSHEFVKLQVHSSD